MSYAAVRSYLSSKDIPQMFEAMMAGLMYHRPSDHLAYMLKCIHDIQDQIVQKPYQWNTFISKKGKADGTSSHVPRSLYHHGTQPILDADKQKAVFVLSESKNDIHEVCTRIVTEKKVDAQYLEVETLFHERLVVEGFGRWDAVPPCAFVDYIARASSSNNITLVSGFPRHLDDLLEWETWSLPYKLIYIDHNVKSFENEESECDKSKLLKFCSARGKNAYLRLKEPDELNNALMEMALEESNMKEPLILKEEEPDYSVLRDMPVICFVGVPGAGKSSQSASVGHKFDMSRLNVVELVRQEHQTGILNKVDTLSDEQIVLLLKKGMMKTASTAKGYILDDFPTTVEMGQRFEEAVSEITVILNLEVSKEIALERYIKEVEEGAKLKPEEAVREEIELHSSKLQPVLTHFGQKVITVSSAGSAAEIFGNVAHVIEGVLELPLEEEDVGPVSEEDCVKTKAETVIQLTPQKSIEILRNMDSEADKKSAIEELEEYVREVSIDNEISTDTTHETLEEFETVPEIKRIETPSTLEPVEAAMFEISVPSFPSLDDSIPDIVDATELTSEKEYIFGGQREPEINQEVLIDDDLISAEENVIVAEELVHEEASKCEEIDEEKLNTDDFIEKTDETKESVQESSEGVVSGDAEYGDVEETENDGDGEEAQESQDATPSGEEPEAAGDDEQAVEETENKDEEEGAAEEETAEANAEEGEAPEGEVSEEAGDAEPTEAEENAPTEEVAEGEEAVEAEKEGEEAPEEEGPEGGEETADPEDEVKEGDDSGDAKTEGEEEAAEEVEGEPDKEESEEAEQKEEAENTEEGNDAGEGGESEEKEISEEIVEEEASQEEASIEGEAEETQEEAEATEEKEVEEGGEETPPENEGEPEQEE